MHLTEGKMTENNVLTRLLPVYAVFDVVYYFWFTLLESSCCL